MTNQVARWQRTPEPFTEKLPEARCLLHNPLLVESWNHILLKYTHATSLFPVAFWSPPCPLRQLLPPGDCRPAELFRGKCRAGRHFFFNTSGSLEGLVYAPDVRPDVLTQMPTAILFAGNLHILGGSATSLMPKFCCCCFNGIQRGTLTRLLANTF